MPMSSKIRVLDEITINKIAAGEVIENPSSVVKELIENSIDAGSSEISVEIRGGGRQLIRISDNGSGMNSDDALLCLERHATSKLKEIDDIHSLSTMGFRGEAIPSIASISKFMILTSPGKDDQGTMVIVDGGKLLNCSSAVRSKGTTLEVKNLFFNVPARKKFQRSPNFDITEILKGFSPS
jgi:DNA mismatch repair protein MutL